MPTDQTGLTLITADIVSAYTANNKVAASDLPTVIASVHAALLRTTLPEGVERDRPAATPKPTPAEIRASVTPDALISFLNGKSYKALRRHLSNNGISEYEYKHRFGLPDDYPLVAESYRNRRVQIAKAIGLGRTPSRMR